MLQIQMTLISLMRTNLSHLQWRLHFYAMSRKVVVSQFESPVRTMKRYARTFPAGLRQLTGGYGVLSYLWDLSTKTSCLLSQSVLGASIQ